MPETVIPVLRWQFDLTWALFEIHLEPLSDADCLWEPADRCWTVRKGDDGVWRADFSETEPEPAPATTAGWLTWHIGWWWSSALRAVAGEAPYAPGEVAWPGNAAATVDWLRSLKAEWTKYLDGLTEADLGAPAPFPWPDGEHTVARLLAWLNAELMKNVAEIGHLRLQRAALGQTR
ncbi:DinB family protein [Stackebrandtia nassauensis]|uniref:DinB-like domain-containing protein n=1 Tax=Stackebrandtia nassauensis (strain DSM 44728 / CIP 108903 / NRRL B-16338 / NBRC 102104 / LLR-40K-21) TaxID=446470 RepID=D3Q1X8_STANL|nr:DinB family protein [Stackebrandtia nassauensis]ADD41845.1 conserved hypothetical protein [Stackebrandtia nassauensis DSM 44728]